MVLCAYLWPLFGDLVHPYIQSSTVLFDIHICMHYVLLFLINSINCFCIFILMRYNIMQVV